MKRNKKWRWLAGTTAACVLVGALGVGGTIAYMTDNEVTTNTFTAGEIDVDLTEPNYPGNDSPDVKDLVPNQEVQKDPKVTNVGVNDAIVFMSVEVPVKDVTAVKADGTKGAKEKTELFWLKDAADPQGTYANHFSDQWMELTTKGEKNVDTGDTNTYVFAYKTAVTKYAIQASEVLEGNTDLTDALSEENLGKIYDIYFNQNPDKGGGSEDKPEVKQGTETLIDGDYFNNAMKTLSGDLNKIQSIKNADSVSEDAETKVISDSESEKEAVMYFDAAIGTIYIATNAEKISLNEQSNEMFKSCTALTDIDALADWDVSHVYNINEMFSGCKSLQNIEGLSEWNTSCVTDMNGLLAECPELVDITGLSKWDTGKVKDMSMMFYACENLRDASDINDWNISNVTDFTEME